MSHIIYMSIERLTENSSITDMLCFESAPEKDVFFENLNAITHANTTSFLQEDISEADGVANFFNYDKDNIEPPFAKSLEVVIDNQTVAVLSMFCLEVIT